RRAIWALLIAGAIVGAVPLYQQMTGTFDNNYGGFGQITSDGFRTGEELLQGSYRQPRLAGMLGEQNGFAQVMLMLLPLGMFRFLGEKSKGLRILALVATTLIAFAIALTFSRGAALGFVMMLLIMTLMRIIKLYQLAIFTLVAFLLLAALPQYWIRLATIPTISALFSEDRASEVGEPDGSIKGRATEMLAAALVFADYPMIGVGPGMYRYYSQEYGNKYIGIRMLEGNRQAHSLYLGLAADNGALGLILFLAILYVTLRNLARVRKRYIRSHPELANMATGFMLTVIVYMTTGLFKHMAYVRFFWLMIALAGAASYVASANVLTKMGVAEKNAAETTPASVQPTVSD
ncbi:MAG: O-antigen ligase family protein, partial [Chloroflexota bacterium]